MYPSDLLHLIFTYEYLDIYYSLCRAFKVKVNFKVYMRNYEPNAKFDLDWFVHAKSDYYDIVKYLIDNNMYPGYNINSGNLNHLLYQKKDNKMYKLLYDLNHKWIISYNLHEPRRLISYYDKTIEKIMEMIQLGNLELFKFIIKYHNYTFRDNELYNVVVVACRNERYNILNYIHSQYNLKTIEGISTQYFIDYIIGTNEIMFDYFFNVINRRKVEQWAFDKNRIELLKKIYQKGHRFSKQIVKTKKFKTFGIV